MLSYLAAKGITVSQPSIAGIGLVLDIRSRSAQNAVNKLQRKLEFLVESGETAGQEMQEIGASNDPDVDNLRKQLGQAMVELEASREDDAIVVEDVIEDGPAHRSNKFSVGDRVLQVDGTPVGSSFTLLSRLVTPSLLSPAFRHFFIPSCTFHSMLSLHSSSLLSSPLLSSPLLSSPLL
mmetsp:Transcript_21663/g.71675  ORF Transcript_21663/g.71675 Transcript_21663/m.71675 type:complete len:179 (-) Transcript_21663:347-883(-)